MKGETIKKRTLSLKVIAIYQKKVYFVILNRLKQKVNNTQLTFTCSKSTVVTLEKGVKYVQI